MELTKYALQKAQIMKLLLREFLYHSALYTIASGSDTYCINLCVLRVEFKLITKHLNF
jgi:hypothetical protein